MRGQTATFAELRVDPRTAGEIAFAYLDGPERPSHLVRAAYAQLGYESDALFVAITRERARPIRVRFTRCAAPYGNAEELVASVTRDRLLEVTAAITDGDRRHPLMDTDVGGAFDRFRAVHDLLGHAALRLGFDRHSEYATWRYQERFHCSLAGRALATELHGKHSVRWTTGESPDHRAVLLDPRLVARSRELARPHHTDQPTLRPRNHPF